MLTFKTAVVSLQEIICKKRITFKRTYPNSRNVEKRNNTSQKNSQFQ
jgi:hypothetical protein